jgi:hypothetical protein
MGAAHRQHTAQGELRDRSRLVEKLRGGGLQRPGSTLEAEWACTGIGMPAAARLSTGGGDRIREPGRAGGGLRHDRAPAATRILAHTRQPYLAHSCSVVKTCWLTRWTTWLGPIVRFWVGMVIWVWVLGTRPDGYRYGDDFLSVGGIRTRSELRRVRDRYFSHPRVTRRVRDTLLPL